MVEIIKGSELFLIQNLLNEAKQSVSQSVNLLEVKGDDCMEQVISFISCVPLIDSMKVVIWTVKKLESLNNEDFLKIAKKRSIMKNLVVIRLEEPLKTTSAFYKKLQSFKYVVFRDCEKLKDEQQLRQVLTAYATQMGVIFTPEGFSEFIRRESYFSADNNAQKIISDMRVLHYAYGDAAITPEMVCELISDNEEGDTFSIAKYLLAGDVAGIQRQLQLIPASDSMAVLGSLLREFRIAWKSKFFPAQTIGAKYFAYARYSEPVLYEGICVLTEVLSDVKRGRISCEGSVALKCAIIKLLPVVMKGGVL